MRYVSFLLPSVLLLVSLGIVFSRLKYRYVMFSIGMQLTAMSIPLVIMGKVGISTSIVVTVFTTMMLIIATISNKRWKEEAEGGKDYG